MDEIERFIGSGEDVVVFAKEQTGGKGTKNRSFSSQKGGVYATFLLHREDFPASSAYDIVKQLSLAVVKTLERFGVQAKIKWPNDIYALGRKICGMLIKNHIAGDKIGYTVTGIGINVNNEFGEELKDLAVSMKEVLGKETPVDEVFTVLVEEVTKSQEVALYGDYSCVLGKTITVIRGEKTFKAVAKTILPDGRLVLSDGQVLSSEEISIRI